MRELILSLTRLLAAVRDWRAVLLLSLLSLQGTALFAADDGGGINTGLIAIGAALAIGLATFGAASAQGKTASSAMEGIARNPTAKDQLFMPFIISLALMEFHALLGFVISFYWTFFK